MLQLGADIIIPLDELPPYHTEQSVLEASLQRSHRWMARRWVAAAADASSAVPLRLAGRWKLGMVAPKPYLPGRISSANVATCPSAPSLRTHLGDIRQPTTAPSMHLPCSTRPNRPLCSMKTHLADIRQQAMYGVVHGGLSLELRQRSIDYLTSLPFDGFAVGGSLGKDR